MSETSTVSSLVVNANGKSLVYAPTSPLAGIAEKIRIYATSHSPVIIVGESGTGKELVAQALHFYSPRKDQLCLAVDCGAFAESVLESELFGHVKGAFTGAIRGRKGAFEEADKGSLFLDEITNLTPSAQSKLLRALENGEVKPVGSSQVTYTDVRIIVASSYGLEKAVNEKKFRSDLYYRLNVFTLRIPPLRDRSQDIEYLANTFIVRENERYHAFVPFLSEQNRDLLMAYPWPGNVRELKNAIERAHTFARSSGSILLPEHFGLSDSSTDPIELTIFENATASFEKRYILNVLESTEWHITRAAEVAGLSRTYLHRLMKKHGIERS